MDWLLQMYEVLIYELCRVLVEVGVDVRIILKSRNDEVMRDASTFSIFNQETDDGGMVGGLKFSVELNLFSFSVGFNTVKTVKSVVLRTDYSTVRTWGDEFLISCSSRSSAFWYESTGKHGVTGEDLITIV